MLNQSQYILTKKREIGKKNVYNNLYEIIIDLKTTNVIEFILKITN